MTGQPSGLLDRKLSVSKTISSNMADYKSTNPTVENKDDVAVPEYVIDWTLEEETKAKRKYVYKLSFCYRCTS